MRKIFLALPVLFLFFPGFAWASTARSSVQTNVQSGNAEVYQSVEVTVNGKTIKKESREPGKLELKMEEIQMEKIQASPSGQTVTPTSAPALKLSFAASVRELLSGLTSRLITAIRINTRPLPLVYESILNQTIDRRYPRRD
ncbi:hypothetical protein A2617_04970 [Candidatus Daviesbacteria bacterium RIFOXYD1_FULL_41_10]|uniref:Uncharacterized protein n=1 Tax=Candidatus Daviesbacteria bacterium RIFOXYD1_FULL_41_10 TaxID=1797801 RepID=A0A1F5N2X5_9BACT|nr:MAG: hypothetical protein A2617_04970 [Candidatus Daviesbacteria bacterium RIFOXYD1_FULL_41_10]